MQRTYTIAKGHQYSADGVRVRMTGQRSDLWVEYSALGVRESGDLLPESDLARVEVVVRRVAETGATERMTLGEADAAVDTPTTTPATPTPTTPKPAPTSPAVIAMLYAMHDEGSDL